jgi:hypothetical protein
MTKQKSAKAKSKSKSKKVVSKTIAGMKIPKSVRKMPALGTLLTSELGREILADALIAAAGAAAAALTRTRPVKEVGAAVAEAGSEAATATRDTVQTAAGAVADVVTEAARSILPASVLGTDDHRAERRTVRYAHRSTDHSSRKRSKPTDRDE